MGLFADILRPKINPICTGCCNSKDLINSDKTGLDPILLPVLNLEY